MSGRENISRWMILGGAVLLVSTSVAHLFLAYPGLRKVIAAGRLVEAPDLMTGITEAAFVIVGVVLALLSLLTFLQFRKARPDRGVVFVVGLVPLLAGLIIGYFAGMQLPVFLLEAAAILLLAAASRLPADAEITQKA